MVCASWETYSYILLTEKCIFLDLFLILFIILGLGLDQYRRYDPKVSVGNFMTYLLLNNASFQSVGEQLNLHLEKNSIFYKLGSYGLITFSDYIFLLTVLSSK